MLSNNPRAWQDSKRDCERGLQLRSLFLLKKLLCLNSEERSSNFHFNLAIIRCFADLIVLSGFHFAVFSV